jgi:hypothetical protein
VDLSILLNARKTNSAESELKTIHFLRLSKSTFKL